METAKPDRGRDHEAAARPRLCSLGGACGLLDIGKDTPGALQITRAGIGQCHGPRGPLQQPRAETLFQRRDQPRHPGRRQAELARGGRKAPEVGDGDEGLHGVDTVHGIIAYIAMMKCQSNRLFKFRESPFRWRRAGVLAPASGDAAMSDTHTYSSDVAFTPAVKSI